MQKAMFAHLIFGLWLPHCFLYTHTHTHTHIYILFYYFLWALIVIWESVLSHFWIDVYSILLVLCLLIVLHYNKLSHVLTNVTFCGKPVLDIKWVDNKVIYVITRLKCTWPATFGLIVINCQGMTKWRPYMSDLFTQPLKQDGFTLLENPVFWLT